MAWVNLIREARRAEGYRSEETSATSCFVSWEAVHVNPEKGNERRLYQHAREIGEALDESRRDAAKSDKEA